MGAGSADGSAPGRTPVVIIGAGSAGLAAAEVLGSAGVPVTLVSNETELPYDRRLLSKGCLLPRSLPPTIHPPTWYRERSIDLRLGASVRMIDRDRREVLLDDGSALPFSHAVVASGAWPRRSDAASDSAPGVHYLRSWADAARLRDELATASRLVIAGGGWIALEVAATLRPMGIDVTILHRGPDPLEGEVAPEDADRIRHVHEAHGVRFRGDSFVAGTQVEDGRLVGVRASGLNYDADVLLVAIGALPRSTIAEDCGLQTADGVLVDEFMRTNDPHVLAAGDVASAFHPMVDRHVRVATWRHAMLQGRTAAHTILGDAQPLESEPILTSAQYDMTIRAHGFRGAYRVTLSPEPAAAPT